MHKSFRKSVVGPNYVCATRSMQPSTPQPQIFGGEKVCGALGAVARANTVLLVVGEFDRLTLCSIPSNVITIHSASCRRAWGGVMWNDTGGRV